MWIVEVWEYERGWGNRFDFSKEFDEYEDARNWQIEFNSKNDEDTVPDWYMMANDPYETYPEIST